MYKLESQGMYKLVYLGSQTDKNLFKAFHRFITTMLIKQSKCCISCLI